MRVDYCSALEAKEEILKAINKIIDVFVKHNIHGTFCIPTVYIKEVNEIEEDFLIADITLSEEDYEKAYDLSFRDDIFNLPVGINFVNGELKEGVLIDF